MPASSGLTYICIDISFNTLYKVSAALSLSRKHPHLDIDSQIVLLRSELPGRFLTPHA